MKADTTLILVGILLIIAVLIGGAFTIIPGEPVLTWDIIKEEKKSDSLSGFSSTGELSQTGSELFETETLELTSPSRAQTQALQHWASIESAIKTADQVPFCDLLSPQEQLTTQCKLR